MRHLVGLKRAQLQDEVIILKFRHFLEHHGLGKVLFKEVNKHLEKNGLMLREGSIVDATIISAPSSTKNESGQRDPDMHQTRKGKQYYFGIKMHIGVDDTLGLIHSIDTTATSSAYSVMSVILAFKSGMSIEIAKMYHGSLPNAPAVGRNWTPVN